MIEIINTATSFTGIIIYAHLCFKLCTSPKTQPPEPSPPPPNPPYTQEQTSKQAHIQNQTNKQHDITTTPKSYDQVVDRNFQQSGSYLASSSKSYKEKLLNESKHVYFPTWFELHETEHTSDERIKETNVDENLSEIVFTKTALNKFNQP